MIHPWAADIQNGIKNQFCQMVTVQKLIEIVVVLIVLKQTAKKVLRIGVGVTFKFRSPFLCQIHNVLSEDICFIREITIEGCSANLSVHCYFADGNVRQSTFLHKLNECSRNLFFDISVLLLIINDDTFLCFCLIFGGCIDDQSIRLIQLSHRRRL